MRSVYYLLVTTITLAANNDDGVNWEWSRDVLVCVISFIIRSDWIFL